MNTKAAFILLAGMSTFAVACGGAEPAAEQLGDGDDVSTEDALRANVKPGSFKLYSKPNTTPHQGCDLYTELDLKAATYSTASLEERVGGSCEIAVIPNARTYRLKLKDTDCGTRIYSGSLTKAGKHSEITITDNRARVCRNVVLAQVIVEEKSNGQTVKKYSYDGVGAQAVTVTGTLVRTYGIGGENTGRSIREKSGATTELVLDASEEALWVNGKTARVKGTTTTLSGVETHNRPAIDVSNLLVCPNPGYVDCMPGPTVSSMCSGEDNAWVTANCQGVLFAF